MITVTSLTKNTSKESTAVFSNGEEISLTTEELCAFHIFDGRVFEEEEYNKFYKTLLRERAKASVIQMVLFSKKTEKQVKDKVCQNGFDEAVADDLILELRAKGYLDDEEYARKYISNSIKTKAFAVRKMRTELITKGISEEIINKIFEELKPDDNELCRAQLEKKLRISRKKPAYSSLCGFLERKGFTPDVIIRTLKEYDIERD